MNQPSSDRRLFEAMAAMLSDVVFTASTGGAWDFVSPRLYEITGLPVGSALENGWPRALHPGDRDRVMRDWNDAVASGTAFESHFRLQTPDGRSRRFVAQARSLCDDSGQIVRWIGAASDVEDLSALEDALQERKKADSKLAHDLRNALAPIQNGVAILRDAGATPLQRQRAIEIIEGQVGDLRAFLDAFQDRPKPSRE